MASWCKTMGLKWIQAALWFLKTKKTPSSRSVSNLNHNRWSLAYCLQCWIQIIILRGFLFSELSRELQKTFPESYFGKPSEHLQGTFLKVILQSSQDLTRTLISTVPFKGALWRRAPGGPSVELLQPFNPNRSFVMLSHRQRTCLNVLRLCEKPRGPSENSVVFFGELQEARACRFTGQRKKDPYQSGNELKKVTPDWLINFFRSSIHPPKIATYFLLCSCHNYHSR